MKDFSPKPTFCLFTCINQIGRYLRFTGQRKDEVTVLFGAFDRFDGTPEKEFIVFISYRKTFSK